MESRSNFENRVFQYTGTSIRAILPGTMDDFNNGRLIARCGTTAIVTISPVLYEDKDGKWYETNRDNLRKVTIPGKRRKREAFHNKKAGEIERFVDNERHYDDED